MTRASSQQQMQLMIMCMAAGQFLLANNSFGIWWKHLRLVNGKGSNICRRAATGCQEATP